MGSKDKTSKLTISVLFVGAFVGILITLASIAGYHAAGSPVFCMACHSMQDVAATWKQSQHKQFACIECHLPDSNIAVQLAYKTKAGLNDLYHETLRTYPAFISISSEARGIAEGNCLRCHSTTVQNTFMVEEGGDCLACHHGLVHGTVKIAGGISVE